jgi:hypothetical protein
MKLINKERTDTLFLECAETTLTPGKDGEPGKIKFKGYSGAAVNLRDIGFDAPVVYDIATMEIKNSTKILYDHGDPIGHTEEVTTPNNAELHGKGLFSIRNARTEEVEVGMRNKFPYEGSMGIKVPDYRTIEFYSKGEIRVNNRVFQAPIYVIRNSVLREMTITPFGRDSDTNFEFLNEEKRMLIKNAEGQSAEGQEEGQEDQSGGQSQGGQKTSQSQEQSQTSSQSSGQSDGQGTQKPTNESGTQQTSEGGGSREASQSGGQGTGAISAGAPTYNNSSTGTAVATTSPLTTVFRAQRLLNKYPEHVDVIENGMQQGWDDERIGREVALINFEKGYPTPPRRQQEGDSEHKLFEARMQLSYDVLPERLEKQFGEKVAQKAYDLPEYTVTEQLLYASKQLGGNFTGHSDVENMCKFLRNSGYSTFDLPAYFEKTAKALLDQRWELNPPFAPSMLKDESNKDFRKTQRRRLTGGEMWKGVADDGRLKHYTPGKDTKYETELDTVGHIFSITRKEVVDDDQGALRQMMDAMIEGALMVPDYQLGKLLFEDAAAGSFWVDNDNSFTATPLTRANLSARYKAIRKYNDNRNGMNWNVMINDKWNLIVSPDLEEEAWEIINQRTFVSNTTTDTLQGERNFWFGRLGVKTFGQMANESAFGTSTFVSANTWMLWPSSARYSPFVIVYLRGRKRPIIEPIELPGDMLGRALRGYWDVNVNKRERLAVMRANG